MLIQSCEDWGSMIGYHMKSLTKIFSAEQAPDEIHTCAESKDIHFIDITLSDEDGDESDPIFYVLVDRHY
jgi:hypothetical protein